MHMEVCYVLRIEFIYIYVYIYMWYYKSLNWETKESTITMIHVVSVFGKNLTPSMLCFYLTLIRNYFISWIDVEAALTFNHLIYFCSSFFSFYTITSCTIIFIQIKYQLGCINSFPHSATYMCQWIALVQIMACCLFGAEPLSEPMLAYYQLDPY